MSARDAFVAAALNLVGQPVVWGGLDCSDLVARAYKAAGGPDQRSTHTAQRYFDESRPLLPKERALPGDLVFWGELLDVTKQPPRIWHVGIVLSDGDVLSADGATSKITDLEKAKANPLARVKVHSGPHFRRDPLVVVHRHLQLDALDGVSR